MNLCQRTDILGLAGQINGLVSVFYSDLLRLDTNTCRRLLHIVSSNLDLNFTVSLVCSCSRSSAYADYSWWSSGWRLCPAHLCHHVGFPLLQAHRQRWAQRLVWARGSSATSSRPTDWNHFPLSAFSASLTSIDVKKSLSKSPQVNGALVSLKVTSEFRSFTATTMLRVATMTRRTSKSQWYVFIIWPEEKSHFNAVTWHSELILRSKWGLVTRSNYSKTAGLSSGSKQQWVSGDIAHRTQWPPGRGGRRTIGHQGKT